MSYTLKTMPEIKTWSETTTFTVEKNGQEYKIEVTQTPQETLVSLFDGRSWVSAEEDLVEWVSKDLSVHEFELHHKIREAEQLKYENETTT